MKRPLGIIATQEEIDLYVSYIFPPIPTRSFDWGATDRNTYDADWDGDRYVSKSAQGFGATEMDAINDLIDQLEIQ